MYSHKNIKRLAAQSLVMPISAIMRTCCGVLFQEACEGKCSDYQGFFYIFFLRLTAPQVERKQCKIFKCVLAHPSMYRSQSIEIWMVTPLSAVGEHWLHAECRVHTSHTTVHT